MIWHIVSTHLLTWPPNGTEPVVYKPRHRLTPADRACIADRAYRSRRRWYFYPVTRAATFPLWTAIDRTGESFWHRTQTDVFRCSGNGNTGTLPVWKLHRTIVLSTGDVYRVPAAPTTRRRTPASTGGVYWAPAALSSTGGHGISWTSEAPVSGLQQTVTEGTPDVPGWRPINCTGRVGRSANVHRRLTGTFCLKYGLFDLRRTDALLFLVWVRVITTPHDGVKEKTGTGGNTGGPL